MAKTMEKAVTEYKKLTKLPGGAIVYQFPKGHWSVAGETSDVGLRLLATGHIYEGVKAQQFYRVTL
jgi:hypothetical protein